MVVWGLARDKREGAGKGFKEAKGNFLERQKVHILTLVLASRMCVCTGSGGGGGGGKNLSNCTLQICTIIHQ